MPDDPALVPDEDEADGIELQGIGTEPPMKVTKTGKVYRCECGREFAHAAGLGRHKWLGGTPECQVALARLQAEQQQVQPEQPQVTQPAVAPGMQLQAEVRIQLPNRC